MSKLKNSRYSLCVNLLNSFSEKEIEGLTQLVSCRYFNTDNYVIKLLKALKKYIIGKRTMDLTARITVYEAVFEDDIKEKFSKAQQGRLYAKLNALTRLSEEFLLIQGLRKDEIARFEILSNELFLKKQDWLFDRSIKKLEKKLNNKSYKDIKYYQAFVKIEESRLRKIHLSGSLSQFDYSLVKLNYYTDLNYILQKLGLQMALTKFDNFQQNENDMSTFDVLLLLLKIPAYSKHNLISLYKTSIELLETQKIPNYFKLLDILEKESGTLSKNNLVAFYRVASNFCVQQINIGTFNHSVLLELYKTMHLKNLLIEEHSMQPNTLKNLVTIGCRLENFEWAHQMIKHYLPYIHKDLKNSVLQFNLGLIAFNLNEYNKAINHFIKVDHINLTYDVNCRVLILRSHYELDKDYDERTVTIFRSAEKFFAEHKTLPKNHKRGYKNFVHILTNLYRVKHRASKMSLERIKASVEKSKINIDKMWLIEKMKELE